MARPLVSVITPAYNVAPYIGACIESVQAQTLTDWEMIIVDDASTDETVAVVERYLSDERIRFLRNEQNMGAGYTRNRALEHAQGEWIAVLDSDDWYAEERLERLVGFAQQMGVEMVADLSTIITGSGEVIYTAWSTFGKNPRHPRRYSVEEVIRCHPSFKPLIRADFVRQHAIRYPAHIRQSQDYAFYMEILIKGARFALLPESLYFRRLHSSSITAVHDLRYDQLWLSCDYLCRLPEATPRIRRLLVQSFRRRKSLICYRQFVQFIKRRAWRDAWRVLCEEPSVGWRLLQFLPVNLSRWLFRYDPLASTTYSGVPDQSKSG